MSRGGLKITRSDYSERETGDRVSWIDSFARKIEQVDGSQNAVEAARARDHKSIVDQISAIMSGRSNKKESVEGVVQDMQDRIGLKEYLRRINAAGQENVSNDLPKCFSDLPEKIRENIKNYITNTIETHHGNIHVPAIVESVIQMFRLQGVSPQHVNDMEFEKYISDKIVEQKQKNPSEDEHNANIGKGIGVDKEIDSANTDMFESLMPVKN